jgi:uncharacterized small protein (TIGR04563 family)
MPDDKRLNEDAADEGRGKLTDKRKQSLYFPEDMLAEIKREALRQDRSLSWIVQQSWRLSREEIKKFPSINTLGDEDDEDM